MKVTLSLFCYTNTQGITNTRIARVRCFKIQTFSALQCFAARTLDLTFVSIIFLTGLYLGVIFCIVLVYILRTLRF